LLPLRAAFFGLVTLLAISTTFVEMAPAQVFTGTAASAMGGAGRAAVDPAESVLLNPAALPHLQGYFVAGHYGMGWHPVAGNTQDLAVLISDGTPDAIIPGSLSYVRRFRDLPSSSIVEQDLQVAVGGFILPGLALGVAGHRLTWQTERLANNLDYTQNNAHVGLLYTPQPWLGLAFTAYDVFTPPADVPVQARVVPTLAIGSHVIIKKIFRLRLDLERPETENPNHRINVMAGLESYFQESVAFRLGAQWRETADQTLVTTGLAFKGPRLSFDYTFQRDVRTAEDSRHLFDLWLPF
jgi:hypothetical protein